MAGRDLRIRVLLDAVERVTGPLKAIAAGAGGTGKKLKEIRDRLRDLDRAAKDVAAFRALKVEMRESGAAMAAAQKRAQDLAKKIAAVEKPTRQMAREFKNARDEVRQLEGKQREQARTLNDLRGKITAAGGSTRQLADHERRLKEATAGANRELKIQQDRLQKVARARAGVEKAGARGARLQSAGAATIGAGAAVAAPLLLGAREAVTFEDAMADVRKVVNFDSPKAFQQMGKDIKVMSMALPMAKEGIAQIIAEAGQADIPTAELKEFATDAVKMAVAFDKEAGETGEMMATWRTAFAMNQVQVRALADQVNYLGNTTAAGTDAVSAIVTRVGALGDVAGLSSAGIAALGATLASVGVEEEIAATGIKNTLLALTKGAAATKMQRTAMKGLGLEAGNLAKSMQMDAGGTIIDVMERIAKLPKDAQLATLGQLFGTESVAAIAPMLTQLDDLRSNLAKVGDKSRYAGSMQAEFATRSDTTSNALQIVKNTAGVVAQVLGDALLPDIKALAEWAKKTGSAIFAWAEQHPGLVKAIARAAAIVSVLLIAAGALMVVIGSVMVPLATLRLSFLLMQGPMMAMVRTMGLVAASALRMSIALLANPIGLVVAAVVAAIVVLAVLIRKYWEPIKAVFSGVWQGLMEGLKPIRDALAPLKPIWDAIVGGVKALFGWIGKLLAPVKLTTQEFQKFQGVGRTIGKVIAVGLMVAFWPITLLLKAAGLISKNWDKLRPVFAFLGKGIKLSLMVAFFPIFLLIKLAGLVIKNWDALKPAFANVGKGLKVGLMIAFAPIMLLIGLARLVIQNWGSITGFFGGVWERVKGFFSGGIAAITMRILSFSPVGLFVRVFAALWPWFMQLGAKFATIGQDLINGVIRGVKSKLGELKSTIKGAASSAANWFKERLGIHSPSRVFAQLGDFTMQGLQEGLQRSQAGPVAAMQGAAGAITRAMATGAQANTQRQAIRIQPPSPMPGAGAAAGGGRGGAGGGGGVSSAGDSYEIHIHAAPGMDERTLLKLMTRELDRRAHEKSVRRRTEHFDYDEA